MPPRHEFIERAAPFRGELTAHCYRMLGSAHDAEDLVQEAYLRGWRHYPSFKGRSSLRTWLYRIATSACLRELENRTRRVLPAGLTGPTGDPNAELDESRATPWVEPFPDAWLLPSEPETAVVAREGVRLALIAALQQLPARQRAVLILRDVVQFSATEVAELLDTTPAAVNSALQRARAHLAAVRPSEDDTPGLAEPARRVLVDRYAAAFERADIPALTRLLRDDVRLEMPPLRTWFTGRAAVTAFLATHVLTRRGDLAMVPTAANGEPALAAYRRRSDPVLRAHALHLLTPAGANADNERICQITVFLDPTLFHLFGLPATRAAS
jgi:RNA polymerase sigma-70 factor, ECF subfamily